MSSSSSSPEVNGDVIATILAHAARVPARDALVFADPSGHGWRRLTYADLTARVRRTAAGLAARGVGTGVRVVVLVPVSPDLYVVLLAVASLGAVAVLVEPTATPAEISRVIRVTRPVAFVGIPKAHALRVLDRDVSRVPLAVVVGSPRVARALQGVALTDLEQPAAPSGFVWSPDAPFLLTFSPGTPQGAVRSGELLAAQHDAMARLLGADDHGDTPYVHVSAFAIVLLSTLISGGTAVVPPIGTGVDDVDADRIVDVIRDRGVTTVSGSPGFLAPIVEAAARRATGAASPHPLASLRRIVTGSAPGAVDLCERALRVLPPTCQLIVAYGSSEAEPLATVDARVVAAEAAAIRRGEGLLAGTERAALVEVGKVGAPLVVEPRAGVARLSARARSGEAVRHLAAHGVAVDAVRVAPHLPVDPRHRATLDCPTIRRRFA